MSKIVGTQNCGYLVYGFSKFCGGTQNLWVFKNCGYMYSKFVSWVLKFVGIQNLWVLKIYLYSKFAGLKVGGYSKKLWVLKLVGIHTPKIIDTQNIGHYILWVLKSCGYSKFVII